jgi:hypothetical protein
MREILMTGCHKLEGNSRSFFTVLLKFRSIGGKLGVIWYKRV